MNDIIVNQQELTNVFYSGCKEQTFVGLEYEKLPVYQKDYTAAKYEDVEKIILAL